MLPQFASHTVWSRLLGMGERDETKVTVFHGVPAMYARLVADHETLFGDARTAQYVRDTLAQRMRLMCAGSAPLPDTLFHKWEKVRKFMLWSSLTVFEFPLLSSGILPKNNKSRSLLIRSLVMPNKLRKAEWHTPFFSLTIWTVYVNILCLNGISFSIRRRFMSLQDINPWRYLVHFLSPSYNLARFSNLSFSDMVSQHF